jgi:hypothetical protein
LASALATTFTLLSTLPSALFLAALLLAAPALFLIWLTHKDLHRPKWPAVKEQIRCRTNTFLSEHDCFVTSGYDRIS